MFMNDNFKEKIHRIFTTFWNAGKISNKSSSRRIQNVNCLKYHKNDSNCKTNVENSIKNWLKLLRLIKLLELLIVKFFEKWDGKLLKKKLTHVFF